MASELTQRIRDLRKARYRGYDWGHRVMILVGRNDDSGSYGVPRPGDLFFRFDNGKLRTTRDHADVCAVNDGEWRVFDSQNDGFEVVIGYWPEPGGGQIQRTGLDGRVEQRLFLRWFVWDGLVKAEWFGLRRWLYYKALHAVVEDKVPFTCQVTPPPSSGGYSHWHCRERRKHKGDHRFRNYTWAGGDAPVVYDPVTKAASDA